MNQNTVKRDALISHRFRGFSARENTLEGLHSALDFGVSLVEFDVRAALCGTPMVYHDPRALDENGAERILCHHKASAYEAIGGTFAHMPTLDALLRAASVHNNKTAKLLIDVKDIGFEHEIYALVRAYRLENRTVFVSWLPEILYRLHEMDPAIPICFSHWCMDFDPKIMTDHIVYKSKDGVIGRRNAPYVLGESSGWSVSAPLTGDMLVILKESGGGVCVPQMMLTRALSDYYHNHDLFVSTFSYIDMDQLNAHNKVMNIDLFFSDNKYLFEVM